MHRGRGPDGTDEGFFCARCGMVLEHAGGADGHVHRLFPIDISNVACEVPTVQLTSNLGNLFDFANF